MKWLKSIAVSVFCASLAACGSVETTSRGIPLDAPLMGAGKASPAALGLPASLRVSAIHVTAPNHLSVSEANSYFPRADIVWRGDAYGDRHAQISEVVKSGLRMGIGHLNGAAPVVLNVEITRFHALTEKSQFSIGGTHDVQFILTVTHAQTGAVLLAPHALKMKIKAPGGDEALAMENAGRGQKVLITEGVAQMIRADLGV